MTAITPLNIGVQWNEDYLDDWLLAEADGTPVDLTNYTFALEVREAAGIGGTALATASLTKLLTQGHLRVFIPKASIAAISSGQHVWRGAFDLLGTYAHDSTTEVWAAGAFIIEPGVTS